MIFKLAILYSEFVKLLKINTVYTLLINNVVSGDKS